MGQDLLNNLWITVQFTTMKIQVVVLGVMDIGTNCISSLIQYLVVSILPTISNSIFILVTMVNYLSSTFIIHLC